LFGLLTLGTVLLALSPFGARLVAGIPLAGLVAYQVFRVPLEWTLHRLYTEGVIPVQMTYAGQNFDVVSGILAAALALLLWAGHRSVWLVAAWNVIGLLLLANIVAVAVLSTPVPFRHFMNEPANLLPSTFPYVWLPTFLVQAALLGHLVVFRAIFRSKGTVPHVASV
jgi:phosphoglycerol transferase MdoB-like AlkP superfamily enzyme